MPKLIKQWSESQSSPSARKDATLHALDSLPVQEAASIEANAARLGQGIRSFGRLTALEVLAALGILLEDRAP